MELETYLTLPLAHICKEGQGQLYLLLTSQLKGQSIISKGIDNNRSCPYLCLFKPIITNSQKLPFHGERGNTICQHGCDIWMPVSAGGGPASIMDQVDDHRLSLHICFMVNMRQAHLWLYPAPVSLQWPWQGLSGQLKNHKVDSARCKTRLKLTSDGFQLELTLVLDYLH